MTQGKQIDQQLLATPHKCLIVLQRLLAFGGIPGCPHGTPPSGLLLKNRRAEELQICELVSTPQFPVNSRMGGWGHFSVCERVRERSRDLEGLAYAFNVGSL